MKKWKPVSIAAVSVLLISGNLYLVGKHDSKAERSVYADKWSKAIKGDVAATFNAKGTIAPYEEFPVYFSSADKEFKGFLVKKGDAVQAGTPLYEYSDPEAAIRKGELEREKAQAESNRKAAEEYIASLEQYASSLPEENEAENPEQEELKAGLELNKLAAAELTAASVQQEIYKQQYELAKLEDKVQRYESEISAFNEESGTGEAASEVSGTVVSVHTDLKEPVITVASDEVSIEGRLSEDELKKAKEGQKMIVSSPKTGSTLSAELERIVPYPDKKGGYPFKAVFNDKEVKLPAGSRVHVSVITDENRQVPVVPRQAVHLNGDKKIVYQLTKSGRIDRHYVETGITAEGKTAVLKGVKTGETLLTGPDSVSQNHSTFITPVQKEEGIGKEIKKLSAREILRYILTGLIER